MLRSFFKALHDHPGLMMSNSDRRSRLVDVLTTGTATGCVSFHLIIIRLEIDLNIFRLGENGNRRRRGVNPPFGFGIWNTLNTMSTAFVLQFPVATFAFDGDGDFLESTELSDARV